MFSIFGRLVKDMFGVLHVMTELLTVSAVWLLALAPDAFVRILRRGVLLRSCKLVFLVPSFDAKGTADGRYGFL